jgi:hypothetical protein
MELSERAQEVARLLSRWDRRPWATVASGGHEACLQQGTADDADRLLLEDGYPGRIVVSGAWPRGRRPLPYGHEPVEITVGAERPNAIIAREIHRRLLPAYRDALVRVIAHNQRDRDALTARQALAARFVAVLQDQGGYATRTADDDLASTRGEIHAWLFGGGGRRSVTVTFGWLAEEATVTMKALRPAEAERVLAALVPEEEP